MAVFNDIKKVRLDLQDPANVNDLIEVADLASLPASPLIGVAYKVISDGSYRKTDKQTGAISADYYQPDIRLSDSRISDWIDEFGVSGAVYRGLRAILLALGNELRIIRNQSGADSWEFSSLKEIESYYRKLMDDQKKEIASEDGIDTGTFVHTKHHINAGGNI